MKKIRGINFAEEAFADFDALIFVAEGGISEPKTVQVQGLEVQNMITKVVFPVGHNDATSSDGLTLNGIPVVSNQNGTLLPIPHHEMVENGETVYKVLDPNTVLEMYYTTDYDGNGNPAFVVVGNPLVLSSSTYSIYANGYNDFVNNCELSDPELITLSTSSTNPTIMEYDGELVVKGGSQVQQGWTGISVYIKSTNDTQYRSIGQSARPYMSGAIAFEFGMSVSVKKGDSVYASGSSVSAWARFYKKRDCTNR